MSIFKKGRLKIEANVKDALIAATVPTVTYLIVRNNPQFIDPILEWHEKFDELSSFADQKISISDGLKRLVDNIDEPFVRMQLKTALTTLNISIEGPLVEMDMSRYEKIIDTFVTAVSAAAIEIDKEDE